MKTVQFIEKNGHREFAVVPIELWNKLADQAEELEDEAMFDQAKASDDGTRIPADVLQAELLGDHPVKAWRKHRKLTQEELAASVGISKPYMSQIESRKRVGTSDILAALSKALNVPMELLHEGS
jgi:DNA-binding XRE family transcriptional regulator